MSTLALIVEVDVASEVGPSSGRSFPVHSLHLTYLPYTSPPSQPAITDTTICICKISPQIVLSCLAAMRRMSTLSRLELQPRDALQKNETSKGLPPSTDAHHSAEKIDRVQRPHVEVTFFQRLRRLAVSQHMSLLSRTSCQFEAQANTRSNI